MNIQKINFGMPKLAPNIKIEDANYENTIARKHNIELIHPAATMEHDRFNKTIKISEKDGSFSITKEYPITCSKKGEVSIESLEKITEKYLKDFSNELTYYLMPSEYRTNKK